MSRDAQRPSPPLSYPLGKHHPERLHTPTGKTLEALTFQAVLDGRVTSEDLRITAETLHLQAGIAESVGRTQLAGNFRRAGELTAVSDERILQIYNALRPGASTRDELLAIAKELEEQYGAASSAALVREAASVYERRGILSDSH
ncbi:diol dehydratase small subunit [Corallococcus sp. bb12-1]|uniref:diol dehydratase small subunit n=1 Tax=Corallococcus sp. bb12-1 TaxID=2996784 RepID=UPI0022719AA5|nr:diol dehydratase small subunit [Corallococcus sp. bb12-1]MCY1039695.1 diol dehydratase small subunit [Corallococcus sp. bb12-1]